MINEEYRLEGDNMLPVATPALISSSGEATLPLLLLQLLLLSSLSLQIIVISKSCIFLTSADFPFFLPQRLSSSWETFKYSKNILLGSILINEVVREGMQ